MRILCLSCSAPLSAVQLSGTDGTGNHYTTAPSDDFGFANVAQVFDSTEGFYTSGVYLGHGWMLSAYHEIRNSSNGFAFGNVLLNGTFYGVNPATAVRISDPATQLPVDLAMFQLAIVPNDPTLKTIVISGTTPVMGSNLILIGNGLNRTERLIHWTDSWVETIGTSYAYSGYIYGTGQSMRWGTGILSGTIAENDDYGVTSFLFSTFQDNDGSAIAAFGDSGGGVFYKNGTTWELSGILLTIDSFLNQPINTSVLGDNTYAADLAYYSGQINSVAAITPGYNAWAHGFFKNQFADSTISGPTATPQHDGIPNALKYFCDINPSVPMSAADRAALPTPGLIMNGGTSYLTLTYRQNAILNGITSSLQTSLDLQTWSSVLPDSTQTMRTDPVTGDPIIQLQMKSSGAQKIFLRLQLR